MPFPFLTAEWRSLAMLNYPVEPGLLEPFVPAGLDLDLFEGVAYVSLVGFLFLDCRLMGVPVPLHRNFEEVNLRFYVLRRTGGELRRGVVFLKEIVPRAAIAWTARAFYNEPYAAMLMRHVREARRVGYGWKTQRRWHSFEVDLEGEPALAAEGSEQEFITEHYWGYCAQRDGVASSIAWSTHAGRSGMSLRQESTWISRRSTVRPLRHSCRRPQPRPSSRTAP